MSRNHPSFAERFRTIRIFCAVRLVIRLLIVPEAKMTRKNPSHTVKYLNCFTQVPIIPIMFLYTYLSYTI